MEESSKQDFMIKKRITTGWTITRALYLLIGVLVLVQAAVHEQWLGVLLGGYISFMGLFAFGCASGTCFNDNCDWKPDQDHKNSVK